MRRVCLFRARHRPTRHLDPGIVEEGFLESESHRLELGHVVTARLTTNREESYMDNRSSAPCFAILPLRLTIHQVLDRDHPQ